VNKRYPCMCCGFLTLPEPSPGSFEICHVCYWQDDKVGFLDAGSAHGPNAVSLTEARRNFRSLRASEPRFVDKVRPPLSEEMPPEAWPGGKAP
jgi:hypothetical protein